MKIESTAFTMDDVNSFMASYREHERYVLADRLQQVSRRLADLAPRIGSGRRQTDEWSAHELLAHIAVVSKFYGVVVHRIASGQLAELDLLESVNLRDVAGEHKDQQHTAEVLAM